MGYVTKYEVECKDCGRVIRINELQYDSPTGRIICKDCMKVQVFLSTPQMKLYELISAFIKSGRGILELKELSEVLGIDEIDVKKLISQLIREKKVQGTFTLNGKSFINLRILEELISNTGRLEIKEASEVLGINEMDVKTFISQLIREKKVQGSFTLDGKSFIAEKRVMEEKSLAKEMPKLKEKKGEFPVTPKPVSKPSSAWYLVPLFLGLIGGLLGYIAVKDEDKEMADNLLTLGIIISGLGILISWSIISRLMRL